MLLHVVFEDSIRKRRWSYSNVILIKDDGNFVRVIAKNYVPTSVHKDMFDRIIIKQEQ